MNFALMDPRRLAQVVDHQAKARIQAMERGARASRQDDLGMGLRMDVAQGEYGRAGDRIVERTPSYQRQLAEMPAGEVGAARAEAQRGVTRGLASLNDMGSDEATRNVRDQVLSGYASEMNRGPGGVTRRGVLEGAAHMANNDTVRRGGLIAAGAGATVASGALLTAGAQQLLALMDYLQHGQQVQQQAAKSPLLA